MSGEERTALICQRLTETFAPVELQIVDDSHKHAGHRGNIQGGGHFSVTIVAEAFAGKSLIQRHRMVYAALSDALENEIHALSISAKAPGEDVTKAVP